ncbi:MAG: T9SS type A sorting domain-containing protein [Chitinophagaceae bacterium]|nr:T9SS type A sorting domain-containing protein [Chitinophagaceae bacterium]
MFDFFSEAGAQISDASGNLLFYTDGRRVFNRAGFLMQNGDSIVNFHTNSTISGTFILPVNGNSDQYYIFSLEQYEYYGAIPSNGRLAYSIVDMTLDSGFGGVLPTSMGIHIDSTMSEKMTVIPGSNCNMWVVTHRAIGNSFCAFSVSSTGVSPAVISTTGSCTVGACYWSGGMRVSNNGLTIVTSGSNGTELHDFDPATGVVSNSRVVNTLGSYGHEFSPDDTKLYLGEGGGSTTKLVQLNISLPTVAAIMASRVELATGLNASYGLKLAPDGKIYLPAYNARYLDCINNPNLAGTASGYTFHALTLLPTSAATVNLPSVFRSLGVSLTGGGALCAGGTLTVTPSAAGGVWNSSNPAVASVSGGIVTGVSAGTVAISYTLAGCTAIANVSVVATPAPIGGNTTGCVGFTTVLSSSSTGGIWISGTPGVATVNAESGVVTGVAAGTACITYALSGGCPVVTTTVSIIPGLPPITGAVPALCIGNTITLSNTMPGGIWLADSYHATVALTTGVVTAMYAGAAHITYTIGGGCYVTASMMIDGPPDAGGIAGPYTVCEGNTIKLTNPFFGGTWSCSNTNATVSSPGMVTGVTPGTCDIIYRVTNTCGSDSVTHPLTIHSTEYCDSLLTANMADHHEGVLLFPNPTHKDLQITSVHSIGNVSISNVVGQCVFSGKYNTRNASIDMAHLPRGIYIVRVGEAVVYKVQLQ